MPTSLVTGGRATVHERYLELQRQQRKDLENKLSRKEFSTDLQCAAAPSIQAVRAQQWLLICCSLHITQNTKRFVIESRSIRKLQTLFLPICWRRIQLRRKRRQDQQQITMLRQQLPPPEIDMLTSCDFFSSWPAFRLRSLLDTMQPVQFAAGEYIIFAGDPGDKMYCIHSGSVDVIAHQPGPCKSRARIFGDVVGTLGPRSHFGEFALLNDEPHLATVQCKEPTVCWVIEREAFQAQVANVTCSDRMWQTMLTKATTYYRQNMHRFHPLTHSVLQQLPQFNKWTDDILDMLIVQAQPHVLCAGDIAFHEGAWQPSCFFVSAGQAQAWRKSRGWKELGEAASRKSNGDEYDIDLGQALFTIKPGDTFGEVGCMLLEPQPYTVRAVTTIAMWELPRAAFRDIILQRPDMFLKTHQMINSKRAAWIDPPSITDLLNCTPLQDLLRSQQGLRQVLSTLEPHVVLPGEEFRNPGITFVVNGTLQVNRTSKALTSGMAYWGNSLKDSDAHGEMVCAAEKTELWVLPRGAFHRLVTPQVSTASDAPGHLCLVANAVRAVCRMQKRKTSVPSPSKVTAQVAEESLQTPQQRKGLFRIAALVTFACTALRALQKFPKAPDDNFDHCLPKDRKTLCYRRHAPPALLDSSPLDKDANEYEELEVPSGICCGSPVSIRALRRVTKSCSPTARQSRRTSQSPKAGRRAKEAIKFASGFIPPGFAAPALASPKSTVLSPSRRTYKPILNLPRNMSYHL